jgi:hypothetical protein
LRVTSQIIDERQSYLVDVELRDENRDLGGSNWWRWVENMSSCLLLKIIVGHSGLGGEGGSIVREKERRA